MPIYRLINKANNTVVVKKAKLADNFFLRLKGLMFRKEMADDEALIFYHTPSIHTFFMRFPIDVVFLNKERKIIRICQALRPFRAVFCVGSFFTIELSSGKVKENSLKSGDILDLIPL